MNIIELAKQVGLQTDKAGVWVDDGYIHDELERLVELARADEREECAKFVDHILKEGGGTYGDAIRKRGTT